MKNCLIIYFSQSGQALNIANAVSGPLKKDFNLHFEELRPATPFPFPWKGMSFFQAFPESVMEIPCPLEPFSFDINMDYDLIILSYPIWYLSAPIPLTSFLLSQEAKKIMHGKPVVTMMGVRNMWVMAQERVKARIRENGGKLVGNIVLEDPYPNLVSVITIVRWMMTAEKHGGGWYGKLFPPAGVPDRTIAQASIFGDVILKSFREDDLDHLQDNLLTKGAVRVHPVLANIEQRAKIMFGILARWILKKGGYNDPARVARLKVFKYYLFTVIYLVSPIASLVFWFTGILNPKGRKKITRKYSSLE